MAYIKQGYTSSENRKVVFTKDEWIEKRKEIKKKLSLGITLKSLGDEYGVSRERMRQVVSMLNKSGNNIKYKQAHTTTFKLAMEV